MSWETRLADHPRAINLKIEYSSLPAPSPHPPAPLYGPSTVPLPLAEPLVSCVPRVNYFYFSPSPFLLPLMISRLGQHLASPNKPRDKRRTNTVVRLTGQHSRRLRHLEKIHQLKAGQFTAHGATEESCQIQCDPEDFDLPIHEPEEPRTPPTALRGSPNAPKHVVPRETAANPHSWKMLIPQLVGPYLKHKTQTTGIIVTPTLDICHECEISRCGVKTFKITCIYFDRKLSSGVMCLIDKCSRFSNHRRQRVPMLITPTTSRPTWTLSHCTLATTHGHFY